MMTSEIFAREGMTVEAAGNCPLLLNDPAQVFLISAGMVDVFAVPVQGITTTGPRTHLWRALPGDALFGLSPDPGMALVAVGLAGAKLLRLDATRLQTLATVPEQARVLANLLDRWVESLSLALRQEMPPKTFVALVAIQEAAVAATSCARPSAGTLWVRRTAGRFTFMGQIPWPADPETTFPVCHEAWFKAEEAGSLAVIDTRQMLQDDPSWRGLEGFHQLALATLEDQARLREARDRDRLTQKTGRDRRSFAEALAGFVALLAPEKKRVLAASHEADPLLAACLVIGREMGIIFTAPTRQLNSHLEPLDQIARASRVRSRRIHLQEGWYRQDHGPLLGFLAEDGRPLALIPTSERGYDQIDPATGVQTRVTKEAAKAFAPFGHVFYRSFPERSMNAWDLLRHGMQGCRSDLLMIILMGAGGALLSLLFPLLTGLLFDSVIPEASEAKLLQVCLILLCCTVVATLFEFTKAIATLRIKGKVDPTVEAGVLDRVISLPVAFFRKFTVGDLAGRAMGICSISQQLSDVVLQAILGGAFSSINFLLLFWYDWQLALIAVGLTHVGIFCTCAASIVKIRFQRQLTMLEGRLSGTVLQLITGIAKLRVSGTEERAFAIWARDFARQKRLVAKSRGMDNLLETFNASFPILASMVIFAWVIGKSSTNFTTGVFLAFVAAYSSFQGALLQMSMAITSILNVVPLYERAQPIIETLPEAGADKPHPGELSGDIELKHLYFRYTADGPWVVDDVSLHIEPGEFVALVGSSGSGKSTLFRLLLGFETPEAGGIYVDGQDIASLDIREVRRQTGVVLQSGSLMTGDIFQNIVGSANLTLDDAWEAARMAGLDEDIKAMPLGMRTQINAGGLTLSGGQRQRLLIARAIVHRPRILLFDEATSALDNHTQAIVSRSLGSLQATRVVIAHRLSTIIHADRIVVLDKGRIIQSGAYEELIHQEGAFAELARRQIA